MSKHPLRVAPAVLPVKAGPLPEPTASRERLYVEPGSGELPGLFCPFTAHHMLKARVAALESLAKEAPVPAPKLSRLAASVMFAGLMAIGLFSAVAAFVVTSLLPSVIP